AISLTGGFLLSSRGDINFFLLFSLLFGTSLVIASNSVLNNIIDCDIDRYMHRTCYRVLPKEILSIDKAYFCAFMLGCSGLLLLYFLVGYLSVLLCLFASFVYIIVYTVYMKRNSTLAPLIGSISGAIPPLIGYSAVNEKLDFCALLLFLIFIVWQIPHSFAICVFRMDDYKRLGIPVFPVIQGILLTKHCIVITIILFIYLTTLLYIFNFTNIKYLIISSLSEISWLLYAIYGYRVLNNQKWAKKLFVFSIIVIVIFNCMIALDFHIT
ncbi:protoheme IX farnesyltransferase, partial [Buchnera aphidicola (Hormaphis cornu)]